MPLLIKHTLLKKLNGGNYVLFSYVFPSSLLVTAQLCNDYEECQKVNNPIVASPGTVMVLFS